MIEFSIVSFFRTYSERFLCDFDMSVYPFDTQECSAVFIMKGNSGKFVKPMVDVLAYLGPIDLTQYFVEYSSMKQIVIPPNLDAIQVKKKVLKQIVIISHTLKAIVTYKHSFIHV